MCDMNQVEYPSAVHREVILAPLAIVPVPQGDGDPREPGEADPEDSIQAS